MKISANLQPSILRSTSKLITELDTDHTYGTTSDDIMDKAFRLVDMCRIPYDPLDEEAPWEEDLNRTKLQTLGEFGELIVSLHMLRQHNYESDYTDCNTAAVQVSQTTDVVINGVATQIKFKRQDPNYPQNKVQIYPSDHELHEGVKLCILHSRSINDSPAHEVIHDLHTNAWKDLFLHNRPNGNTWTFVNVPLHKVVDSGGTIEPLHHSLVPFVDKLEYD